MPLSRKLLLGSLLLVALVAGVYAPLRHHDFVRFDDGVYIEDNPWVRQGLTWEGARWAFSTTYASNWHPLTWLSHMLDVELFGLDPAAAHGVNVLLHAANAALLFIVLSRMTGRVAPSLAVAALFAVHPLRVESVAWAAERKDLLAAFFGLLALGAYERYARSPRFARYLLVMLGLALGLLAKPMLVTLPLVLLLLDFWPLSRFRPLEKLPLLALSLASAGATLFAQWRGGSVGSLEVIPLVLRLENALVSYVVYLYKTLWPAGLACFYPYPAGSLALPAAGAAALLGLITAAVLYARKRFPYLAVGWLWYAVMLLPVSGVIQVGMQALADRYTYLPAIGLYLALVWGVAELVPRRQWVTAAAVTAVVVLALAVTARFQLHHWRDTRALFEHALAVTRLNDVAHVNLGNDFDRTGELDQARIHYERALAIKPSAQAHVNLANVFARSGEADQARSHYEEALRGDPRYAPAHNNLAALAARQGRFEEALEHCRAAIRIDPGYAEAHENLGVLLGQLGQFAEAEVELEQALAAGKRGPVPLRNLAFVLERQGKLEQAEARYAEALKLDPKDADTERRLGEVLYRRGMLDPALAHLRRSLELDPQALETANRLAWILATSDEPNPEDAAEALRLATRLVETTSYEDPSYLETLAAAHAALGDIDAALSWQTKAVELTPAPRRSRPAARLELYRLRAARKE